jgi:ATP-dependent RNA helicase RhlB
MKFEEFNLHEDVMKGIRDAGFTECMPVQEETLKKTLEGKDVTVQSQTGSGKTAAFLVTIFQRWCTTAADKRRSTMIIAPTRELAVQIEEEAKLLGAHVGMKVGCFYGGMGYKDQQDDLKGGVDLYIGTPGRLIDFGQSRKIDFKTLGTVVIDEADRLFDMGFYPDIKRMMRMMVPREERTTLLFSATLGTKVLNVAWEHMNLPEEITIESEYITVDEISQELYHVEGNKKFSLLLGLLKKHDPPNALVFTNMKITAVEVAKRLSKNGYAAKYLMGDLPQKKRLSIINKVKAGELRFLVATDVAARGLHVDDLAMVINYDIPEDPESYVHRIGRTARAGKSGKAITLACESYVYGLEPIEELIERKIPVQWADEELFLKDESAGFDFRAEYRKASRDGRSKSDRMGSNRRGADRRGPERGSRRSSVPKPGRKPEPAGDAKRADAKRADTKRADANTADRSRGDTGSGRGDTGSGRKNQGGQKAPRQAPVQNHGNSAPRKPVEHRGAERRGTEEKSPTRETALEKRLEMYRKKYGEDFQLTVKGGGKPKSGRSAASKKRSSRPKTASGNQQSDQKTGPENRVESREEGNEPKGLFSKIKKRLFRK